MCIENVVLIGDSTPQGSHILGIKVFSINMQTRWVSESAAGSFAFAKARK